MSPHPLIGKPAPTGLTLTNANGEPFTITPSAGGKPLVVFFYPAANTHGCTMEACAFRDNLKDNVVFKKAAVEVVGISGDGVDKQKRFVDENGLPYPILSDSKGEARKAFQVHRGLLGLTDGRATFCIDSKGTIEEVYENVLNYGQHVKVVEKWLSKTETEAAKETPAATAAAPAVAA